MASQGALRHVVRRREHRERAQPAARAARFGLLEKHKDYKLRAADYHRKEDALRVLKEKASLRNEDEFYMAMNKATTKKGVHTLKRDNVIAPKTLKLMKAQDAAYLQMQRSADVKRIDKAKSNMHFLMEDDQAADEEEEEDEDEAPAAKGKGKGKGKKPALDSDDDEDDEDEGPARKKARGSAAESAIRSKHVIFVDTPDAVKKFNAASYFGTTPGLAKRTFNRLKTSQLEEGNVIVNDVRGQKAAPAAAAAAAAAPGKGAAGAPSSTAVHKAAAASKAAQASSALMARSDQSLLASYSELQSRLTRKRKLESALDKLQLEKNLAGKGRRSKVVTRDEKFGDIDETKTVYKWKMERKK